MEGIYSRDNLQVVLECGLSKLVYKLQGRTQERDEDSWSGKGPVPPGHGLVQMGAAQGSSSPAMAMLPAAPGTALCQTLLNQQEAWT